MSCTRDTPKICDERGSNCTCRTGYRMGRDGTCSIPDTSKVAPCSSYHRDDIEVFLRNIAPQEFT